MRVTAFALRALEELEAAGHEGAWHEDLYPRIFPKGRFVDDVDLGSSKGGPSRIQPIGRQPWRITDVGKTVLKTHRGTR